MSSDDPTRPPRPPVTRVQRLPFSVPAPEPGELVTDEVRLLFPLASGGMGTVWVAEHLTLGVKVAVKFALDLMIPAAGRRFAREAALAARIDHPHAVRVLDQGVSPRGQPYMVMELLDGVSLRQRLRKGRLTPGEVASLVAQIGSALDAAHARGVVHRDVKPDNILLVGDGTQGKLIDFGIAKQTDLELTELTRAGQIVGTPVYMSPEQLVEVRSVDAGADLWALSVVAYEALLGRRPFDGDTLPAVVTALLMRRYELPTVLDPEIPAALDDFFARAFHVDHAMRFTDAAELAAAFAAACTGPVGASPPQPGPAPLRLPDRLYGRAAELAALEEAFSEAAAGPSNVVLVSGFSGVGKTALARELRRRLVGRSAGVVGGKFDPYDRDRPYQSLIQAFRDLIRGGVARRDPVVLTWCQQVTSAGADAGLLTSAIGDLEDVVGTPVQGEELPPTEQRARFQVAMSRLIGALGSPAQPLVVFWDDLQWADLASLDLLAHVATDPEIRHVLLVCAYRDREVGDGHPLLASIDRMRASGRVRSIRLGPLGAEPVLDLVSDAFPGLSGRTRLAAAAHAKTGGNAFFLRRFLETLVERELVRKHGGGWDWDPDGVAALDMPDDVVAFVIAEIQRMPVETRQALVAAACIGDRFELGVLAQVLDTYAAGALDRLRPALATELVVARAGDSSSRPVVLRFAHDRVRQAARGLVDAGDAARIHRTVGRYLLRHLGEAELEARLFEVVEHLNRGVHDPGHVERARLRALNLSASRRAIRSAAFEVGDRYLRHARSLLDADAWSADYAETLAIHLEGARAAYLTGDYGEMEALVQAATAEAREPLHRVAALEVSIQARLSQQRFAEALALAVDALALLGATLPRGPDGDGPTPAEAQAIVAATLGVLASWDADAIARLPVTDDPVVQARRRIMIGAMSSAYMAAPTLLPVLACDIVRSTLDHGLCRHSAYGLAVLGLVLIAGSDIEAGYRVGRVAADVLDRIGDRAIRPRTLHILSAHVMLFVEPLRKWVEVEQEVARLGLDTGDLEYAAWGLHCQVCNGFYAGLDLDRLAAVFARSRATLEHHRQLAALGCTQQYGRAIACLRGETPDPGSLAGPDYDEQAEAEAFRAANFRGAAYILAVMGAYVRFVFRRLEDAARFAEAGAEFVDGAPATYHVVWWQQVRALAVLGGVTPGADDAAAAVARVAPEIEALRAWNRSSEVNHAHRLQLVEGELARVQGRTEDALAHFARGAELAATHGFLHEEALAVELEARCWLQAGDRSHARAAGARAIDAWARWGATAKAEHLEAELTRW